MPTVLIADDDEQIRKLLASALEQQGYEVLEASDGDQALSLCAALGPDAAVVDILMPGKEGLQTIREMRSLCPDVKVVAITGGGLGGAGVYLELALKLGAHTALPKPFAPSDLVKALAKVLGEGARVG